MSFGKFTILFFGLLIFLVSVSEASLTFWSNETKEFFAGESKLTIDHNAYVSDYDLEQGWIKIYTNLTEVVAICDPFSGKWIKKTIKRGENNITLPFKPQPYAGLRLVIVSSPFGFASVKEKSDAWAWYDYPIVILRSEMAKWSWERTAYALGLFIFGLALSRHMKKDKLIVSGSQHILVMAFIVLILFGILSMKYTTETIKINETIKKIPHLVFDTYYIKEWYNYFFAFCFVSGYLFGLVIWSLDKIYVAYVGYSQPLKIYAYPYDSKRKVLRDFDGKLALLEFKNGLMQFINIDLNGFNVKGILATGEEELSSNTKIDAHLDINDGKLVVKKNNDSKLSLAVISFFSFLALCIVADYISVFKIDLPYAMLFSAIIAIITNLQEVKARFGFEIEKIKVIECSELMNEDNYTKMLKEAEIKHVVEEYHGLLRALIKEKITQPRRTIQELLSVIREVKEVDNEQD